MGVDSGTLEGVNRRDLVGTAGVFDEAGGEDVSAGEGVEGAAGGLAVGRCVETGTEGAGVEAGGRAGAGEAF